jgi:very-short-patch-repair endonuclease
LAIYGLRVMRFTNAEVLDNLVYVWQVINEYIQWLAESALANGE